MTRDQLSVKAKLVNLEIYQVHLAKAIGVSWRAVGRIIRGEARSADTELVIAKILQEPRDDLFGQSRPRQKKMSPQVHNLLQMPHEQLLELVRKSDK